IPQDPLYDPAEPAGLDKYCYRYKTVNDGEEYKIRVNYEKTEPKEIASWGGGGISYGGTPPDYALQFDGVNDYVDCGNDSNLNFGTDSFTIEFWIKTEELTPWVIILNKGGLSSEDWYSIYADESNRLIFHIKDGYNDSIIFSTTPINDTQWHHIVALRTPDNVSIYTDKISEGTQDAVFVGGNIDNIDNLVIGGLPEWATYFNGSIDDVRIYNRALSPAEVTEHYNGIFSDETGLAGLWHFDEGSGDTTADDSGNGNNGSLAPACPDCPTWVAR
ncbi:MAG: LamG domain-containing protein, partial [bacterium]